MEPYRNSPPTCPSCGGTNITKSGPVIHEGTYIQLEVDPVPRDRTSQPLLLALVGCACVDCGSVSMRVDPERLRAYLGKGGG